MRIGKANERKGGMGDMKPEWKPTKYRRELKECG
jgi:hypothetical protein